MHHKEPPFSEGELTAIAKCIDSAATHAELESLFRDAGLSRESLYKALSGERAPAFDTILKVISALGLKLHAEAQSH